MSDFKGMMRKAQELQSKIAAMQEELSHRTVEASAGGGMVTVSVSGSQELVSVAIDPKIMAEGDREMLEDLVVAAVNEGLKKSKEMVAVELSKIAGGLPLPGLA